MKGPLQGNHFRDSDMAEADVVPYSRTEAKLLLGMVFHCAIYFLASWSCACTRYFQAQASLRAKRFVLPLFICVRFQHVFCTCLFRPGGILGSIDEADLLDMVVFQRMRLPEACG